MALGIPPRFRVALNRIASLSDADLEALATALTTLPPFPSRSTIRASIASVIAADEEVDNDRVTDALLNLAVQRRRWGADELANLIASSSLLTVPEERRESFERLIKTAVDADALLGAARGLDVVFDRENILSEARILTDIRPVFGDEVEPNLRGAAVISTLSIDYYAGAGGPKKVQLAIDERDLRRLNVAIERALKKGSALRELLSTTDTQYFDYTDDDDE